MTTHREIGVRCASDGGLGGLVAAESDGAQEDRRAAEELEDGSLDPDELDREQAWWDEGGDDE